MRASGVWRGCPGAVASALLTLGLCLLVSSKGLSRPAVVINEVMASYKATLADYKEPTKVHAREITASSLPRAEELRNWTANGRLPAVIQGRALLFPETKPDIEAAFSAATANTDSLLGEYALAGAPVLLPGKPMVSVGNRSVPDISQKTKLTGPYIKPAPYGFGFSDLSKQDKLYKPVLVKVERPTQLDSLLGKPAKPEKAPSAPCTPATHLA